MKAYICLIAHFFMFIVLQMIIRALAVVGLFAVVAAVKKSEEQDNEVQYSTIFSIHYYLYGEIIVINSYEYQFFFNDGAEYETVLTPEDFLNAANVVR